MAGFRYCRQFGNACLEIIENERATEQDIEFVENVHATCATSGFVSAEQASWIGILHQNIVHKGKYVENSWWI